MVPVRRGEKNSASMEVAGDILSLLVIWRHSEEVARHLTPFTSKYFPDLFPPLCAPGERCTRRAKRGAGPGQRSHSGRWLRLLWQHQQRVDSGAHAQGE